jgi:hypothetical protein
VYLKIKDIKEETTFILILIFNKRELLRDCQRDYEFRIKEYNYITKSLTLIIMIIQNCLSTTENLYTEISIINRILKI